MVNFKHNGARKLGIGDIWAGGRGGKDIFSVPLKWVPTSPMHKAVFNYKDQHGRVGQVSQWSEI